MTDTALAADHIRLCAGRRGYDEPKKVLLNRAFNALHKLNRKWTRRRVRALWGREAARVEHREIVEMRTVIALREAKREYAAVTDDIARLEALLSQNDATFHSETLAALDTIRSSLDRTRAAGDKQ